MRVAPRAWIGFTVFVAYTLVVVVLTQVGGVDYDELQDSVPNALGGIVLPIGTAAVLLAITTTALGWWRPALRERVPVGPWWLWVVPVLVLASGVVSVAESDLGSVDGSLLVMLLVSTAVVGFAEELLVRGVVLTALRSAWRELVVWFTTCLLFGLLHAINALSGQEVGATAGQMVAAFVGGSAFYVVRRVTGALVWAMAAHCLWDFGQLVVLSSGSDAAVGTALGDLGLLLAVPAVVYVLVRDHRAGGRVPSATTSDVAA
ncbi:CPBP family intramembrane glutamic endopeptidase [Isoptericola aurantiacus]|uniref:CPBP family intramembrane glutamic endopeptidase n=1 Tax=Isoptericola aurantiacus TaxID=3377839 RepID=UPI00383B0A5B